MSNRTQYENDLAALKTALTEMGQSAADAVEAAMEALCTPMPRLPPPWRRAMAASTTWSGTLSTAA